MWDSGFLLLLITSSSEHRKHQFLIHSMLFFQHLLGMKIKTMTICIWFHFLSLCDDAEILVSNYLDPAFLRLYLRFFFFFSSSTAARVSGGQSYYSQTVFTGPITTLFINKNY